MTAPWSVCSLWAQLFHSIPIRFHREYLAPLLEYIPVNGVLKKMLIWWWIQYHLKDAFELSSLTTLSQFHRLQFFRTFLSVLMTKIVVYNSTCVSNCSYRLQLITLRWVFSIRDISCCCYWLWDTCSFISNISLSLFYLNSSNSSPIES